MNPFNNSVIFAGKIGDVSYSVPETSNFVHRLGLKRYELVNHLGNVQAVISDRKIPRRNNGGQWINFYEADVMTATDYYPFGMVMANRSLNTGKYRYGYNGKEFDQEWDNGGATYDYGFRIYDSRICRFLSVDPLTESYPWLTPYQFAENTPIFATDLDGAETNTPALAQSYFHHANKVVVESFKSGLKTLARTYDFFVGAEDAQKAASGKDWDGKQQTTAQRVEAAGWVALSVVPFSKLAKGAKLAVKGLGEVVGLGSRYGGEIASIVEGSFKKAAQNAKEIFTITKSGTLEDALKVAKSETGDLGSDAAEYVTKVERSPFKGKTTGWQSADGKRGWRVDFDNRDGEVGAHINWWTEKEKGSIPFKASENQVNQIVNNEIVKSLK